MLECCNSFHCKSKLQFWLLLDDFPNPKQDLESLLHKIQTRREKEVIFLHWKDWIVLNSPRKSTILNMPLPIPLTAQFNDRYDLLKSPWIDSFNKFHCNDLAINGIITWQSTKALLTYSICWRKYPCFPKRLYRLIFSRLRLYQLFHEAYYNCQNVAKIFAHPFFRIRKCAPATTTLINRWISVINAVIAKYQTKLEKILFQVTH